MSSKPPVEALEARVFQHFSAYPPAPRYWLAYSGGLDSQVLLHCIASQRERLGGAALTAVHINHQLQPAAQEWVKRCRLEAERRQVAFRAIAVDARSRPGESPEAAARKARYQALQQVLAPDDVVLTGQHQTDQAETLLLQLLRGAGPAGLASMPVRKPFGCGWLLRPLLDCRRAELLAYAKAQGLHWIEDDSNSDERFDRNFLRHQILPVLHQRWPAAEKTLARSAQLAGEASELLTELAQQDLAALTTGAADSLCLQQLAKLSPSRQRNVLRYWLQHLGLPLPSQAQLQQLSRQMLEARQDAQPSVVWPGCEVHRYRRRLYAMAGTPFDSSQCIRWPVSDVPFEAPPEAFYVPGIGRLQWVEDSRGGLCKSYLHNLTIRFRRGGERFQPCGRRHSQSLKKLLQDAAVPPWERDRLPLVFSGNQLIWVPGLGPETSCCVPPGQNGMILRWQKNTDSVSL
ncbi:MAG: tRNA lysidine(34) synthetase TilS [Gammaproteobacteria bacterium]